MPRETKEQMRGRMQAEIDYLVDRNMILNRDNRRLSESLSAAEEREKLLEKLLATTERLLTSSVNVVNASAQIVVERR